MEHKLIQGGEQYLPFARSRIKALKATGLKYASQKFEIDGVSIRVRVAGEHEYIEIEGGEIKILSGAIKAGEVIELPVPPGSPAGTLPDKTLRSYKPTQNAWDVPLKKPAARPPTAFNDEPFLAKVGAQYADLSPSMFSGLMAKAVAVVMGMGKEVKYDYRWTRCHGIVKSVDDKFWLVEISAANGVMAMPLGLAKGDKNSKNDAIKQASLLFGGVPTGKNFPVGEKLTAALAAGTAIRLLTASAMLPFFEKSAYSSAMGWSFSPDGREAHNTCMTRVHPFARGYHYKLAITVGEAPMAALSLVSDGPFLYRGDGQCRFAFYQPGSTPAMVDAPDSYTDEPGTDDTGASAPLLACHINGVLDVVRYRHGPTARNVSSFTPTTIGGREVYLGVSDVISSRAHYITSARNTFEGGTRDRISKSLQTQDGPAGFAKIFGTDQDWQYITTTLYFTVESGTSTTGGLASGLWPGDVRDAYVTYGAGVLSYTQEGRSLVTYTQAGGEIVTFTGGTGFDRPQPPFGGAGGPWPVAGVDSYNRVTMTQGIPANRFHGDLPSPAAMKAEMPSGETVNLSLADLPLGTNWLDPARARPTPFKLRASMFGPNAASTISLPRDPALRTLNGASFAGETTPTNIVYNFVGYI